jgi:hypothetical protein
MTADPPAAEVKCAKCGAVLGHQSGDYIDVGEALVPRPAKLVCKGCRFVRNCYGDRKRVDNAGARPQDNG